MRSPTVLLRLWSGRRDLANGHNGNKQTRRQEGTDEEFEESSAGWVRMKKNGSDNGFS
uniref:Uncharacterized protein n=1 Tax=Steinernema glaseri TaxID=37863 RepID=A0A1I7YME8_9BILA